MSSRSETRPEHTEPDITFDRNWYMWNLPMFGETDGDTISAETDACHEAHSKNHVRLIGHDNYAQSQGTSLVTYRGPIKV